MSLTGGPPDGGGGGGPPRGGNGMLKNGRSLLYVLKCEWCTVKQCRSLLYIVRGRSIVVDFQVDFYVFMLIWKPSLKLLKIKFLQILIFKIKKLYKTIKSSRSTRSTRSTWYNLNYKH